MFKTWFLIVLIFSGLSYGVTLLHPIMGSAQKTITLELVAALVSLAIGERFFRFLNTSDD